MKELRLLLFKDCNRRCKGCCNKDWELDNLPVCKSFKNYKTIMLTGGEPMLNPKLVEETIMAIRRINKTAKIIMYTAKVDHYNILYICKLLDGLTLTLHKQSDVKDFQILNALFDFWKINNKSLRLNIFKSVKLPKYMDLSRWKVKGNIEWIKKCPLPKQ